MCRNIRTLYNYDPPASQAEVRAAAVQYVRKISGFNRPSQANQQAFDEAVDAVARDLPDGTRSLAQSAGGLGD